MRADRGLKGVYVVLVTPLDGKGNQDHESLRNLVRYCMKAGVDGLTALGEVSESPKLSEKERLENLKTVFAEIGKKVPVIVGASREASPLVIEAARAYQDLGAAALMIAPPKNLKLRDDLIFDHYAAISDAVEVPIVVQDEPESNHPYMSVQLLDRLAREVRNARYVKLEDAPTPRKVARLKQAVGNRMKIFGASYGRDYIWEADRGAVGIMTASPTPEYLVESWRAYQSGDREKAKQIFFYSLPLAHYYGDMALAVKKVILVHRGVIRTAKLRQPAADLGEDEAKDLFELLDWAEEGIRKSTGTEPLKP
jgi:4-hydroxy-tetrahydrodipicolinate synthase